MISANEARKRTMLNAEAKIYTEELGKEIEISIRNGVYKAIIYHELYSSNTKDLAIKELLVKLLEDLGYCVVFTWAKERPAHCREDQWVYENGTLEVSWEEI